jgi:excisionase family DNA binding protein
MMDLPRLTYDKEEAAEILGVSVSTVDWLLRKRKLPRRKIGRQIRFTLEDLHAWVEASKVND